MLWTILLTTIFDIIDVPKKLNKIFDRFDWFFFFLISRSSAMETNSFTQLMLRLVKSHLKLKRRASYLTPLPLWQKYARGVDSQYCYTLLQLRYWKISLTRIKVRFLSSKKNLLFASVIALKNDENCFLFYVKSSLRSQDI